MITVNPMATDQAIHFSDAARLAIAHGVQRDDPVANLEYLGMTLRTMNILENSEFEIMRLGQLISRRPHELLAIPNVTPSVLQEILDALSQYDRLEEAQRSSPPVVKPR